MLAEPSLLPAPTGFGAHLLTRLRARWAWQPDKAERLGTVAGLARLPGSGSRSVADIGGRRQELRGLMRGYAVTSVNVEEPCDVLVVPGPLPFPDDAFDVVTSTDVLEHLPAQERAAHLAELVRVAGTRVVLCFPCGTPVKEASEQRLARRLAEEFDQRFDFLDEHLLHGLPRVDDVVAAVLEAAPGADVRPQFQDGVEAAERLLLDAVRAVKGHSPRALMRSARSWLVRRPPALTTQQSAQNNRAYVVIDLPR